MGLTGTIASSVPAHAYAAIPKVPSLLFDMELDDGLTSANAQQQEEMDVRVVEQELRTFLRPTCLVLLKLTRDVDDAIEEQLSTSGNFSQEPRAVDVPALAKCLTAQGYVACLRRAVGGGEGPSCLQNLRHNFLSIISPGSDGAAFVVDPCFTEQFLIAKPTPRYNTILACLPSILVVPEDRLPPLVTFLCVELATAFKASSTVVPPWRQASSLLSKWKPRTSIDETYRPLPLVQNVNWAEHKPEPPAAVSTATREQPRMIEARESRGWSREAPGQQQADARLPQPDQAVQLPSVLPSVLQAANQARMLTVGCSAHKMNANGLSSISLLKGLLHSSS